MARIKVKKKTAVEDFTRLSFGYMVTFGSYYGQSAMQTEWPLSIGLMVLENCMSCADDIADRL